MAHLSAFGSRGGTSSPVTPSMICALAPATADAMQAQPLAIASHKHRPNVSS